MLVQRGVHVFGMVRKEADAQKLQAAFGDFVTPLILDVVDGRRFIRTAVHIG